MAASRSATIQALERQIHASRARTIALDVAYLKALDERSEWPLIVSHARGSGLPKEAICREFSCSWSTVTRWMAGHTAPGAFVRTAIKARLVEMVERMGQDEARLAGSSTTTAFRAGADGQAVVSTALRSRGSGTGTSLSVDGGPLFAPALDIVEME